MENEIKLLKTKYLEIKVPESLETKGLEDLWDRVDKKRKIPIWKLPNIALFSVLILALIVGIIAASSAAKPGTLLYPVKVLSEKAVKSAVKVLPPEVETKVNQIIENNPTTTTTPAFTPTPSKAQSQEPEGKDENNEEFKQENIQNSQNKNEENKLENDESEKQNNGKSDEEHGNNNQEDFDTEKENKSKDSMSNNDRNQADNKQSEKENSKDKKG